MQEAKPIELVYTGGPAFPVIGFDPIAGVHMVHFRGASLRDLFAAAALVGFCTKYGGENTPSTHAAASYEIADAMVAARAATPEAKP